MSRPIIAIVPFEQQHYAMLPVRSEQAGELERFEQVRGQAAEYGPAFSAVEQDEQGHVTAVLAVGGLAENSARWATAWAAFAEGLRAAQWSPIVRVIRGLIEGSDYERIDMVVRADFGAGRGFAEALGFKPDAIIYSREAA